MNEFDALARLSRRLPQAPPGETWIGDDTAVLQAANGVWQLFAADAVVEGVHTDLALLGLPDLGWKAVVANVSDVAAMGGMPGHAVVTVAAPPSTDLDELYDGIAPAAERYGCPVVGGDLVNAPLVVVTVAVTGFVEGRPVLRSGARPGDGIWVTGPLGRSAAGLRLLQAAAPDHAAAADRTAAADHAAAPDHAAAADRTAAADHAAAPDHAAAADRTAAVEAHRRPLPALAEGTAARLAGATAMIDVSDGFAADLTHLADASGVGFRLDEVPVAAEATVAEALGGGEDYVLVFSAPDPDDVERQFQGLPAPIRVGTVVSDTTVRSYQGQPLPAAGWQHSVS